MVVPRPGGASSNACVVAALHMMAKVSPCSGSEAITIHGDVMKLGAGTRTGHAGQPGHRCCHPTAAANRRTCR